MLYFQEYNSEASASPVTGDQLLGVSTADETAVHLEIIAAGSEKIPAAAHALGYESVIALRAQLKEWLRAHRNIFD